MYELNSWHPLVLPSLGRFYKGKGGEPLMPGGNIEVTPWTTQQEEDLVRYGAKEDFTMKVLERNVRLPAGMTIEDLVLGDQFFLLVQLRVNSLTPFFSFSWQCESCEKRTETQIDLRTITCRTPDEDESEPFDVKLPQAGCTVSLRHQRVRDMLAVKKYGDEHEEAGTIAYRFARQIEQVDGHSLQYDERKDFVAGLGYLDFQIMRNAMNERQVGPLLTKKVKCGHCSEAAEVGLPLETSFFRPDRADLERAAAELVAGNRKGDELPCGQEVPVE